MTPEIKSKEAERNELVDEVAKHNKQEQYYKKHLREVISGIADIRKPEAAEEIDDPAFPRSTPFSFTPIKVFSLISEDGEIYQVTDAFEHEVTDSGETKVTPVFYSDIWWLDKEKAKQHWKDGIRNNGYLVSLRTDVSKDLYRSGEQAIRDAARVIERRIREIRNKIEVEINISKDLVARISKINSEISELKNKVVSEAVSAKIIALKTSPKKWGIERQLNTDGITKRRGDLGGCPETALSPCHTEYSFVTDRCGTYKKDYTETPQIVIVSRLGCSQFLCKNTKCKFKDKCKLASIDKLRWEIDSDFFSIVRNVNSYRDYQSLIGGPVNLVHQYDIIEFMEEEETNTMSTDEKSHIPVISFVPVNTTLF